MLFAPLFILIVIYINVYGIKLMKRAATAVSAAKPVAVSGPTAGDIASAAGGSPDAESATDEDSCVLTHASAGGAPHKLSDISQKQGHRGVDGGGSMVSMEEHQALKAEVDRIRQMLKV